MVNEPHLQASTSASQYSAFELELNQLIRKHFRTGTPATCWEANNGPA